MSLSFLFPDMQDFPEENMELVKDVTTQIPFGEKTEKCWKIKNDEGIQIGYKCKTYDFSKMTLDSDDEM